MLSTCLLTKTNFREYIRDKGDPTKQNWMDVFYASFRNLNEWMSNFCWLNIILQLRLINSQRGSSSSSANQICQTKKKENYYNYLSCLCYSWYWWYCCHCYRYKDECNCMEMLFIQIRTHTYIHIYECVCMFPSGTHHQRKQLFHLKFRFLLMGMFCLLVRSFIWWYHHSISDWK